MHFVVNLDDSITRPSAVDKQPCGKLSFARGNVSTGDSC